MTRKIENQMINAVLAGIRPIPVIEWRKSNTRVETSGPQSVNVYLHGHNIAKILDKGTRYEVKINLCGWNTSTTRSRLTALLHAFAPGCAGITTKQGQAYVVYIPSNTKYPICSTGWYVATMNGPRREGTK